MQVCVPLGAHWAKGSSLINPGLIFGTEFEKTLRTGYNSFGVWARGNRCEMTPPDDTFKLGGRSREMVHGDTGVVDFKLCVCAILF